MTTPYSETCPCGHRVFARSRAAARAAIDDHARFHRIASGLREALRSGFCRRTEVVIPDDSSAPR